MPRPKSEDPRTDHHFRANREEIRALDALATRLGVCRSAAIRWAVMNAVLPGDGEERSCFTCGWDRDSECTAPPDDGLLWDREDYAIKSGASRAKDYMPTDRTVKCLGWKTKENA